MGVQEMALMLLGIGLISERFGGGLGLQTFGTGIQKVFAAPLKGTGTGLTSLAGGIRSLAESFGDVGRGISDLLGGIPAWALPGYVGPGGSGSGQLPQPGASLPLPGVNGNGPPLIAMSGDGATSLYAGGGGNVPTGYTFTPIAPSPFILQHYTVQSGLDPYGTAGWYVSNQPIVSSPTGGGTMI